MRIALLALHFAEYGARLALALSAKHEVLLVLRASNAERELTEQRGFAFFSGRLQSELLREPVAELLRIQAH